jgi:hypothetical protein
MSSLSRRHLVTTAAALPALAVPAIADPNGPDPDAKLLRLGVELEALIVEWHAQRAIDADHSAAVAAAYEAAGLVDIDYKSATEDEWHAYQEKRNAIVNALHLDDDDLTDVGGSIAWEEFSDRQWPLIDAIMEHKAQTLAGFAVQVRAVSLSHEELWSDGHAEGEHLLPFIEAACAFAGVVPVPLDAEAVQS